MKTGWPGHRKSRSQTQAISKIVFDVLCEYDASNLLLQQWRREVLEQQLELTRLHKALTRMEQGRVVIMHPPKLTPLAFPLMVDKLRDRLSSETLAERVARMQADLETAAGKGS